MRALAIVTLSGVLGVASATEPPAPATSAAPAAPAAAATPAAATPAAASTPAAAAAPAATATPAAPASPTPTSAGPKVYSEQQLLALGFKVETHDGVKLYCHKEELIGTRLGGHKVCGTPEQLTERMQRARDSVENTQRSGLSQPGGK